MAYKAPGRWKKGESGNPGGKSAGSRTKATKTRANLLILVEQLAEDLKLHGKKTIEKLRLLDPGTYLRVAASLIPKELVIQHNMPKASEQWDEAELLARASQLMMKQTILPQEKQLKAPARPVH